MISRAKTVEEVREEFLSHIKNICKFWANQSDGTIEEKCEGVAFSILNIFDGTTMLPSFDISLSPHPNDKEYCIENNENWYEPGMVINNCMLHELFVKK